MKKISEGERDRKAQPLQKKLTRETHIRPFLDTLFKPGPERLVSSDPETIVCRCEEVTVDQIKKALESGLLNPNQVKAQTRCGMGPCQGRVCGPALALLRGWEADRVRPPLRVSTLGVLASRSKGPAGP